MKLFFSILLLATAVAQIYDAATPHPTRHCTSGSYGNGIGDGYKGACFITEFDCAEDCVKGVCDGSAKPTTTPTPVSCTSGSYGKGLSFCWRGACCKTQADCVDDCLNGACIGPINANN